MTVFTCCSRCFSIHRIGRACVLEPEAAPISPPPASRSRRAGIRMLDGAAILIILGMPCACLGLAGAW